MPTARELLEQADALMRRNRRRDRDKTGGPPTLTDALGLDRDGTLAPTVILPDAARDVVDPAAIDAPATPIVLDRSAEPIALDTLTDVPVLTDVVDVWPAGETGNHALADKPASFDAEAAIRHARTLDDALEADALAARVEDPDEPFVESPDAFPMQPPVVPLQAATTAVDEPEDRGTPSVSDAAKLAALPPFDEEFILDIPPPGESDGPVRETEARQSEARQTEAGGPTSVPVRVQPGSPDWDAMAEEIRMQVLQRLDLFTDTGMRDQLGARLRPIVDRASAELVETINHQLGELVRGYVAEAIEREIDSWRKRDG